MPTLRHLQTHVQQYGLRDRPLYALSGMIFFWCIFDGIVTYSTPLILTERGFSEATMGLIIGSSSIAGAFFDFLISHIFRNTNFKRIFLVMFAICAAYPVILWHATTIPVFILAMAMWGVYYDLYNFGTLSFLGRHIKKQEHASASGVIHVFKSMGYLIGPIVAGLVVGSSLSFTPAYFAWTFLGMAFLSLAIVSRITSDGSPSQHPVKRPKVPFIGELNLYRKTATALRPILILTTLITIYDSFVWTIGPLFMEDFHEFNGFEGFFIAAYQLPALFLGWFIGSLTLRRGKEKTALVTFIAGSLILSLLSLLNQPVSLIIVVFIASSFLSIATPALNGAYADYVAKAPQAEEEIEGADDLAINIGFIIGPISAGFLAEAFGKTQAFTVVAIVGTLIAIVLLRTLPPRISLRDLKLD